MYNLQFLKVYKSRDDKLIFEILDGENRRDDINDVMHIPEEMKFPRRLRFLHWNAYPNKCFPPTFNPGYLVELDMMHGKFEYLWKGTQLKELPDLSNAINLKRLDMSDCKSLVEIPSSFLHLQKLELWWMDYCVNLQIIPDHLNLASLVIVEMNGCSKLRKFLFVSTTSARLRIWGDSFRQRPPSSNICSRIRKSGKLKGLTHLHKSLKILDLRYSDIETIPDCIKALHQLEHLSLDGCRRLASLPELPGSIKSVNAEDCESLETVFCPLNSSPFTALDFTNCFKLGQLARREIIHRSFSCERVILPGRKVPAEFDHRARGSSLTITSPNVNNPLSAVSILKLCVVVSPNHEINKRSRHSEYLLCHCIIGKGDLDPVVEEVCVGHVSRYRSEHLLIFQPRLPFTVPSEVGRETVLEFSSKSHEFDVSECGARVFEEKSIQGSYESEDQIDYLTDGRYESCEDDISRLIDESIELNPANTLQATRHESSEDEWSEDEYELSEEYRQSRREFRTQCRRGSVSQWTDRGILSPVVLDNADAAARNFKLESSIIKSEGMELGLLIL
ncbi:Leucine-rich repeat-containing protein [Hirschfeldia incana]|nr:Leucine-rich repeat-containing protein [Hirschfeldia incana]